MILVHAIFLFYKIFMDKLFLELAEIHDMIGERYRSQAYKRVHDIMDKTSVEFRLDNIDEWKGIPGIGEATEKKIVEYLKTGTIKKLSEMKTRDEVKACISLSRIMGIGPVKARQLFKDHQIRNITQLRKNMKDANMDLNIKKEALLGIKYYTDLQKRIPYLEMDRAHEIISNITLDCDPLFQIQLAGSYRRNVNKHKSSRQSSGDLDVVLTHEDVQAKEDLKQSGRLRAFVNCVKETDIYVDTVKLGKSSATVLVKIDKVVRHMDVRLFPLESFWTALLHYTGSWEHNVKLRRLAIEKNMQLTEYGLFQVKGKSMMRIPIHSEVDVFKVLGLPYVDPEHR